MTKYKIEGKILQRRDANHDYRHNVPQLYEGWFWLAFLLILNEVVKTSS